MRHDLAQQMSSLLEESQLKSSYTDLEICAVDDNSVELGTVYTKYALLQKRFPSIAWRCEEQKASDDECRYKLKLSLGSTKALKLLLEFLYLGRCPSFSTESTDSGNQEDGLTAILLLIGFSANETDVDDLLKQALTYVITRCLRTDTIV